MMTTGFAHFYIETHDWAAAVTFWKQLGYQLQFETDHGSGMLRHPDDGSTIFLAEQPIEDPLGTALYLSAAADYAPPPDVHVISPFKPTHWGTQMMVIQDPDGHHVRIEAPLPDAGS